MNYVDPKHFKKRFMDAAGAVFDAAHALAAADEALRAAMSKLERITGPGYAAATLQLAQEPRRVCSSTECGRDFQASETGRDICPECLFSERTRKLLAANGVMA